MGETKSTAVQSNHTTAVSAEATLKQAPSPSRYASPLPTHIPTERAASAVRLANGSMSRL
jgi:hypothetical protein